MELQGVSYDNCQFRCTIIQKMQFTGNYVVILEYFDVPTEFLQLPRLPGCKGADTKNGEMVSCIMNNKKNITNKDCRLTIFHMQKIIFSDHRLIFGFNQACGTDIYKFKCGSVEKDNNEVCDEINKNFDF